MSIQIKKLLDSGIPMKLATSYIDAVMQTQLCMTHTQQRTLIATTTTTATYRSPLSTLKLVVLTINSVRLCVKIIAQALPDAIENAFD